MWKSISTYVFFLFRYAEIIYHPLLFTFALGHPNRIGVLISYVFLRTLCPCFPGQLWSGDAKYWRLLKTFLHRKHLKQGRFKDWFTFLEINESRCMRWIFGRENTLLYGRCFLKCYADFSRSAVFPQQLQRFNSLTYTFTCWISLYICFDRKAGNSLFHGQ